MKRITVNLTGTMPMLMHSQRGMDLMDEQARQFSILNKKRQKTDSDRLEISDLEFELGLYWDKEVGVYVPSFNVVRTIQDGGKMLKLGKAIIQGLRSDPTCQRVPILYPGRDGMTVEKMKANPAFRDIRTVGVNGKAVARTRPIFRTWGLSTIFLLDEDILSTQQVQACLDKAGLYYGLGDFRVGTEKGGQYGTFVGKVIDGVAKYAEAADMKQVLA